MGLIGDSFWPDLLLLSIAGATIFYYFVKYKQSFFKRKGIPYYEPTFFFGSNIKPFFLLELFEDSLERIYRKMKKNGYGGYYQFLKPAYVICDPGLVEKVLIKDFSHFQDHGVRFDEERNPLEAHLFNLGGDKWRALRVKLSPTFTSGKLKWMQPQMNVCGDRLVKALESVSETEDCPIRDICSRYGMDVIASCAFGLDLDTVNDPDSEFRRITDKVFQPPLHQLIIGFVSFLIPEVIIKLRLKTIDQEVEDFFTKLTSETFQHRLKSGQKRNDFIQLLLQLREKGSVDMDQKDREELAEELQVGEVGKFEMTDAILTAQSFLFFAAGFENTASMMSYLLYYLSKDPAIQSKVREELLNAKKKYGELNYDALKSCEYLDACISETLRLNVLIGAIFRECTKDYVLDDGNVIEKGTPVLIPSYSLHMDPDYFPDPHQFKPERFIENQKPRPGTYLPFGEGPRICIARRFALLQAKVGISKILENYEVLHSTKNKEPLVRFIRTFRMEPIGGLWVRLKKIRLS